MFFMLSKRIRGNHWDQLGIIITSTINEAAEKLNLKIYEVHLDDPIWASLTSDDDTDYYLEHFKELSGPV